MYGIKTGAIKNMSLKEADEFFQRNIRMGKEFAIFFDQCDAIFAAKRMIDFLEKDIEITLPFLEGGEVNMTSVPISKKSAKQYIERYGNEDGNGEIVYQRILDFSEKKGKGRGMWLETYERKDGSYDAVDILTWV